jgi:hypothetical protein
LNEQRSIVEMAAHLDPPYRSSRPPVRWRLKLTRIIVVMSGSFQFVGLALRNAVKIPTLAPRARAMPRAVIDNAGSANNDMLASSRRQRDTGVTRPA